MEDRLGEPRRSGSGAVTGQEACGEDRNPLGAAGNGGKPLEAVDDACRLLLK